MAESSGLIIPLGAWVLARACGEVQGWRTNGYAVDLSVNVSGLQLDDPRFRDTVEHTLETCRLDPHALILEITESVLMRNPDTVVRELLELKRIGIRIAIDDFGTGYSSLAYLQKFPVDELKIDRTFIERIAASDDSRALIHTLVQLGRTLKLATVAEGVEEAAQLVQLRKEECDYAQGFLFARPLAAADTEALLARVSAAPAA